MSGYRPSSTEPQGKWALAIDKKRRELDMSQTRAFEALAEALGYKPKSRSAVLPLLLGPKQPTDAQAKVLAEWLGYWPADVQPGEGGGSFGSQTSLADLSDALTAQAESFARMLAFAIRRDQSVEARIRALEAEVQSLRGRLGVEASPAQPTPPQREG